jgi:5-methylcytosine-specific restriction enzyme A
MPMKGKRPPLRILKPRLRPMGQRLKSMSSKRDTAGSPNATIRSWYKSTRWQKMRIAVLTRDLFTCQKTGVSLMGKHPAPDSPVIHHRVPHKGDEQLFWDIDNLIAVSKAWHDEDGQREDRKTGR